ncbi:unnamed protein product, partial [Choristocarpus tenellus]
EKRESAATADRLKGNRMFKARRWSDALELYMKSLRSLPYRVQTLTNIAQQVHIKLCQWEEAKEFCSRALRVDPLCVKAFSRRSVALAKLS